MGRVAGKRDELKLARDRKLVERYYYHSEVCLLRFDKTLEKLSREEFFITEETIQQIIRRNNDYLNELIDKKVSGKQLKLFE